MATFRSVPWLAPATTLLALLTGSLLAMGHHFFYSSLANTSVPTGSYTFVGKSLPKQQLNTAIGTAFAFLVKAFLTVAVSTAYVQAFWRAMRSAEENPTLAELDCTSSALANALGLFDFKTWWMHPVLLLLTIIFWSVMSRKY